MKSNPYLKNLNAVVFDIETTGLYPCQDHLILGGLHSCRENSTIQFFCEKPELERNTILEIASELSKYDAIITYNGNAFDLPFLKKRAQENGILLPALIYQTVDIYKWLRIYWPQAKNMKSLSQKSVENALGISPNRDDLISGGECIALYKNYVELNDLHAKEAILLHNKDDILQLKRIADSLPFLPYHQIAYEQGFAIKVNHFKMIVLQTVLKKTVLKISGTTVRNLDDVDLYKELFSFRYAANSGAFSLLINCQESDGLTYVDINELPIDSSHYTELTGFFRNLLILKDNDKVLYTEINKLINDLIHNILTEDLLLWTKM
ncbi:MAG: hypothetical protein EOM59_03345 [Clostridia bacterium]|nr:hypothetical protein [Clostridia bacterium]